MPMKKVNRCPSWDEHWGCAISPMKQCSGCPDADWHTDSVGKPDKDDRIYIGGLFEPRKQLLTREPQSPVFVSAYDIAHYDGPETEPDNAGLMTITALHGETPKGCQCPDIKAFYQWEPNGPNKGFTQTLICRFYGSEPHFNHMLRFMCSRKAEYVILLPRQKKPFLFIGGKMTDINIAQRSVEHQTFVMKYGCCIHPLPYYDGPLDIEYCTEPELMKKIY